MMNKMRELLIEAAEKQIAERNRRIAKAEAAGNKNGGYWRASMRDKLDFEAALLQLRTGHADVIHPRVIHMLVMHAMAG